MFESLANELLLDVFGYSSSIDLIRAFFNLNSRLNTLLLLHFQSFSLDFRSISLNDFNLICQTYLPDRTDRIHSLILSDNDDTPNATELFFLNFRTLRSFQSLRSLTICDLCSDQLMTRMMDEWQYLPNLTHLKLAGCYLRFDPIQSQRLIDRIWSLPTLIYCYLNIQFEESYLLNPTVMSSSLKYLFIWGNDHDQQEMDIVLRQTPALEQFSILLNDRDSNNNIQPPVSMIRKLKLDLYLSDENALIRCLQRTPNLSQLTVEVRAHFNEFLNGYQWETLIRNCVPNLQLRFRIDLDISRITCTDQEINEHYQSFQTAFWAQEKKWFIAYHWDSNKIYFYTLPYAFEDFHLNCSMQFKSSIPNHLLHRYYHHVEEFHYTNSSRKSAVSLPIRFPNLRHLNVSTLLDGNIQLIVPNLHRITSLDVSIENGYISSSLGLFIRQVPHLDSLRLISGGSYISMTELENRKIRRVDLREYEHYFNHDDISILFGIQCEILCVRIETRQLLFDLIKNMKNLQMLNIQSNDDSFDKREEDDFILWLKDHLPSTYSITRDLLFPSDIHIWIR